jgi:two-component system KDP operon response regulator KdpE
MLSMIATAGSETSFDLLMIDLGLPDGDGGELLRWARAQSSLPIIIISARYDDNSKVNLLDAGADDYLVKPFSVNELLARIRVALRHRKTISKVATTEFNLGGLQINIPRHSVTLDGKKIHLTPTEFKLLVRLINQAGQVVTHRQLLSDVWGAEYVEHIHYLRLYMAQLRVKLEENPTVPRLLLTEPGVGYRLADTVD